MKTLHIFLCLWALLICHAKASYTEFFGPGFNTTAIGNQSNFQENDPSNNYYFPAILAKAKKIYLSLNISTVNTSFENINNIVIKNATNNANSPIEQTGNVSTDYGSYNNALISAVLPIGYKNFGTISLTVSTPVGDFIETNTGSPFLPEYVFYQSRYKRSLVHLNLNRKWSENVFYSIGTHLGFQASASATTQASLNGTGIGSSASAKAKVSPSLGIILSTVYQQDNFSFGFSYQQEMKSNLEAKATGETSDPPLPFDITIESMPYYDPHIFRAQMAIDTNEAALYGSIEYQIWDSYKTPVARIRKNSGTIVASDNYESVKTKNILIPKAGISININDQLKFNFGAAYRPTPLDGDFTGAGNSIDSNSYIYSSGLSYYSEFFGHKVNLGLSGQLHDLQEKRVQKSSGLENGGNGNKIGSGGYTIDGNVIIVSLGANIEF